MADPLTRRLLALLTLLTLLAGCSGGGGEDDGKDGGDEGDSGDGGDGGDGGDEGSEGGTVLIEAPADPEVGSVWEYEFSGASSGTSTSEVVGREQRNGHDAYKVETATEASGAEAETTSWIRRSDGAVIESQSETDAPYVGHITTTTTFDPPCAWITYPVREGATYTSTCTSTSSTSAGGSPQTVTQSGDVEVVGGESVTVQAGTFDTAHVRITMEDGSVQDSYYRLDGCGIAKSVTTKDGSSSTTELVSGDC